ncbi:MAG: LPS assembly lipoprotein LptE [Rhizomicrobium sp.]
MRTAGAIAVLGLAFGLAGCGFHPLYAIPNTAQGTMRQDLGSIYVEPVSARQGYELRNQLIDLLDARAEAGGAAYRLRVRLSERSDAVGVQSQTVGSGAQAVTQTAITRYNDTLNVDYELVDIKTNAVVTHGRETGLSAYNVLSSPYATLAVQQDAERRAADDIADRIRIDLAVFFAQNAKPKK